jgi:hypothetical protein
MPCIRVGNAIVCTRGRARPAPRCACGKERTRECDYPVLKSRGKRGGVLRKPVKGTCDEPMCDDCTFEPKQGVDLCNRHAEKWAKLREERGAA